MVKRFTLIVLLLLFGGIVVTVDRSFLKAQDNQTVTDRDGFEMVFVPPGSFEMGENLETISQLYSDLDVSMNLETYEAMGILDTQSVSMFGFWIDKYEVTVEQYQSSDCVLLGFCTDANTLVEPEFLEDPDKPIVGVDWYDAMRFCNRRGARLPSESEWEYAASGPDNFIYPWGDDPVAENILTFRSGEILYPVGSISENVSWVGAFDMAGNAAEWIEDRFIPTTAAEADIITQYDYLDFERIIRGGSYIGGLTQVTTYERQTYRPNEGTSEIGFRCARTSDPRG